MKRAKSTMWARVYCDTCGEVSIPLSEIHVRVCLDTLDTEYRFTCPDCLRIVVRKVHPSMRLGLLTHPGIYPEVWFLPEPEVGTGPPISEDEVEAFAKAAVNL